MRCWARRILAFRKPSRPVLGFGAARHTPELSLRLNGQSLALVFGFKPDKSSDKVLIPSNVFPSARPQHILLDVY